LTAGGMPSDVGSLVWQATLFAFEEVSASANSSTLDSTLNQTLDAVWTATGGAGSPPVTLPQAPTNPFVDGLPPISLPPSQLVWTGQPPLTGSFPDGAGQPPLTPPVTGDSPLTGVLPASAFSGWDVNTNQDMLWAGPGSTAATWSLADNTGATGLGNASLPLSAGSIPSDVGSLVWQATLFGFEEVSAVANSSTLDSTLNQILDVVWTATGGSGSPPVTLPQAPTNPFVDGFPPLSLPTSQLVWTGQPPLPGALPDGTGQPPVTPPVAGNSALTGVLPGSTFATLAPQQLVWTGPSQGVPATLSDQPNTGLTALNTLFGRT
jgi:hypothetical protein